MRKGVKWILIVAATAAMIAAVGINAASRNAGNTAASVAIAPRVGFRMPAFTLNEYHSGKLLNTKDLAGKPVFINFWTSWCTFCQAESPDIAAAHQVYGNRVVFLSVNVTAQDRMADVRQFVQYFHMNWPVALDTSGSVAKQYKIIGYPTSFFVNRQGVIENVTVGGLSSGRLMSELKALAP